MNVITNTGELADFCTSLSSAEFVTVDTEFMREKTFWPILCLVQLAGSNGAAAVDPLAEGLDLAPLFDLLAAPQVLKVMHGGRQDIEIFHHLTGRIPGPIYDTQIAAMVCGFGDQVGYETLIAKLTGSRLDKGSRFTDWSLRPLSDKQLRYALDDVIHLRPAYERLRDQIGQAGRESWLAEEMSALTDVGLYEIVPGEAWRRLKPKTTSRRYLAVLREVAAWRENLALERDVPRNRVLRDETLSQLAAHPPADGLALERVRGISRGFADSTQGAALMLALERGSALPADEAPEPIVKPQRPAGHGALVDLLKVLLKHKCETHHVAQKLVATSAELEEIAAATEDDMDDEGMIDVRALHGWRLEVFGTDALRLKRAELALAAIGNHIRLVAINGTGQATLMEEATTEPPAEELKGNGRRRRRRRHAKKSGPQGAASE
ncbi:MAG: ribonuclease D [Alphaproteobacteria bacterium]|nr:ribonuclease D [Alphaproteobacteria bacterium]